MPESTKTTAGGGHHLGRVNKVVLSVFVTARNDDRWLLRLLEDLVAQEDGTPPFELIIVEAGAFQPPAELAARMSSRFTYELLHIPGIPRSKALNVAIERAVSPLVVRLDARTHVKPDYLRRLYELWVRTGAANVGGVLAPMGLEIDQRIIAEVMKQPFCFGGAAGRRKDYHGFADSVYLGAFNRDIVRRLGGYDEERPLISEDSDLNFRIREAGFGVYVDSRIKAYYLARETPREFVRLCRNYGVSRVLFMLKHRQVTGIRQLAVPGFFFSFAFFAVVAMATGLVPFIVAAGAETVAYGVLLLVSSVFVARSVPDRPLRGFLMALRLFVTAHTYWLEGMFWGLSINKGRS